jgi:uncharacterized tellurite resistance protein B-like protein
MEGLSGKIPQWSKGLMLRAIQQFFTDKIDPSRPTLEQANQHKLQVATGALLIEMMRMDEETTEQERRTILTALQTQFDLTEEETHHLVELAEAEALDAIDYHQFTSLIKEAFSPEQKEKVIEYLWSVAISDGEVNKHEEYLVRKIAGLINVPHEVFIAAKRRVRDGSN